jgi:hypothetical protein
MALRNFVTDSELKSWDPNITDFMYKNQGSYQIQINKAFDKLLNDFRSMGINTNRLMVPIDLNNFEPTTANLPLQIKTVSSSPYTSSIFEGHGERRVVTNVSALSGTWTFTLQGSNAQSIPASTDATWVDVKTATLDQIAEKVLPTIDTPYEYYRYTLSGGSSITLTCALYEVSLDDAICFGTFVLLFKSWMKAPEDLWATRYTIALDEYEKLLTAVKFNYDSDENGVITDGEDLQAFDVINFVR